MTGTATHTMWLATATDDAMLVSPTCINSNADRIGAWLPHRLTTLLDIREIRNPRYGEEPQIVLHRGTLVTFEVPKWLSEKERLCDARDIT